MLGWTSKSALLWGWGNRGQADGKLGRGHHNCSAHSPSSLIRCCLLRRASMSKLKSFHSSQGGKEMVRAEGERTASVTHAHPGLTGAYADCGGTTWGPREVGRGGESWSCRWSRMPFQMACRNCSGIFRLAKSCAIGK